jgi:two-component system response regulator DesR
MPGLDGIEASAQIRRRDPEARIVLVTVHAEPMLAERGLAAGALGYVLKDAAVDELAAASTRRSAATAASAAACGNERKVDVAVGSD